MLDVNADVMTLASFKAEPREGLLDRARRVVSYALKFKHSTIRIHTEETDFFSMPITPHHREDSVHGKVTKLLPQDAPEPKGKHVVIMSYHDANLHHNVVIGRLVTGMLRFLNKTHMD